MNIKEVLKLQKFQGGMMLCFITQLSNVENFIDNLIQKIIKIDKEKLKGSGKDIKRKFYIKEF